jgi:NADH-quinone oxidoreductase subunit J
MVLFLFVVMMLDINIETVRSGFTRYAWFGWITAGVVIVEIIGVVTAKTMGVDVTRSPTPQPADYSNTTELGTVLYTNYVYPFELAAVLLLVAIVAAIALTMRKRKGLKIQDIAAQTAVRAQDRVRVIKMEVTRDEPAAAESAAGTPEKGA